MFAFGKEQPKKVQSVLSAVEALDAALRGLPAELVPDFEKAAQELFDHHRTRDQPEEAEQESDEEGGGSAEPNPKRRKKQASEMVRIREVQHWLRDKVPAEAVLPSEKLVFGHKGTEFETYTAANTVSVDGFLYEEEDVDDLCEQGKLSRNICQECGSKNVTPLNFLSHSLSIPEMEFIFKHALPKACGGSTGKLALLDVGSRLGAVVYGASILGKFKKVVGVEMNAELCAVQEKAIKQFGLGAQVVCDDVCKQKALLGSSGVIVLHNAFQFFLQPQAASSAWKTLVEAISPGTVLITCPSLEEQLACCKPAVMKDVSEWVEEVEVEYPEAMDDDDEYAADGVLFGNIRCYRVKARK